MSKRIIQQERKRICLFGTSGDPPTDIGGHYTIVQTLSSLTRRQLSSTTVVDDDDDDDDEKSTVGFYFDQIWVLPVYQHMYSNKRNNQTSFHHRFEMCRLAFESIPRVIVSNYEQVGYEHFINRFQNNNNTATSSLDPKITTQPSSSRYGTIDLLEFISKQEPDTEFTLALGADTFMDLTHGKWKRSQDILFLLQGRIVIFQRFISSTNSKAVEEGPTVDPYSYHSISSSSSSSWKSEEVLYSNVEIQERIQQVHILLRETQTKNNTPSSSSEACDTFPFFIRIPNLLAVSSSLVRSMQNVEMLYPIVSSSVISYIQTHGLYTWAKKSFE